MPVTGSPQWYSLVTSLILGVGIGCLAQPQLVVRFMTVESSKQLNRGVFIGCFFLIITVGAIYHAGALSNLFFFEDGGCGSNGVCLRSVHNSIRWGLRLVPIFMVLTSLVRVIS